MSISGGVSMAIERARSIDCTAMQIFVKNNMQWFARPLSRMEIRAFLDHVRRGELLSVFGHASYLINLATTNLQFHANSIRALAEELVRADQLELPFLVLHPGSFRGADRGRGLLQTAAATAAACHGLDLAKGGLTILIENTAGAEFSLGSSFEQVAEVIEHVRGQVPVGACIDTCHTHVAGYDIVSEEGYRGTIQKLEDAIGLKNVRIWHCNDAKAARGSKLDRHQHIGKGTIGLEPFRRLLNDSRLKHAAFIAETPIDEPGDDLRNVEALKKLVKAPS